MLEKTITRSLLRPSRQSLTPCLRCQWRSFSTTYVRLADPKPKASPPSTKVSPSDPSVKAAPSPSEVPAETLPDLSPLANAPRRYGKRVDKFEPTALSRPIGMQYPPRAGQNTGVDMRSLKQKRDDFVDWDKHLKRRQEL